MKIKLLSYERINEPYIALSATGFKYKLMVQERRLFGLWQPIYTSYVIVPFGVNADTFYAPKLNVWIDE